MMRAWVVGAVLVLGGCQCLQPVAEGKPDGGGLADGGGSADGGAQPQCTSAAQCVGALPSQSLCNFSTDAGFSCIDQRCVFECSKDRACSFDAGPACLDCTPANAGGCKSAGCGAATMQGQVESTTASCQLGFTDVTLVPKGDCQWSVNEASTGTKGVITRLGAGQYVGQFPGLGTCVGVSLFTQVERILFSCEGCQFVLRI